MKRILAASAASVLAFGMVPALADNHEQEARRFVPVETFTCNYRDGKSLGQSPTIAVLKHLLQHAQFARRTKKNKNKDDPGFPSV